MPCAHDAVIVAVFVREGDAYDAENHGAPRLRLEKLFWDEEGWLFAAS